MTDLKNKWDRGMGERKRERDRKRERERERARAKEFVCVCGCGCVCVCVWECVCACVWMCESKSEKHFVRVGNYCYCCRTRTRCGTEPPFPWGWKLSLRTFPGKHNNRPFSRNQNFNDGSKVLSITAELKSLDLRGCEPPTASHKRGSRQLQ